MNAPEDIVVELAESAREIDKSRVKNPLRLKSVFAGPPAPSGKIGFASQQWVIFDGTKQPDSLMNFWQTIQPKLS